jgi:glucose/arabinose dehydrogenase
MPTHMFSHITERMRRCALPVLLALSTTAAAQMLPLEKIKLPPGFEISVFADNVPNARAMARGDKGTLFVGSMRAGRVYAIRIRDNKAVETLTIASGLNLPVGVAFRNGALYVSDVDRILRYDNIETNLANPPQPAVVSDRFPPETHHGWKFIAFGPDGMLYVPVGAPCNICDPDGNRYANIMRLRVDQNTGGAPASREQGSRLRDAIGRESGAAPSSAGVASASGVTSPHVGPLLHASPAPVPPSGGAPEVFARGVRNSVGFDWHPETKELWFTDNGRDWLGDDKPDCELNHAPRANMHFGFPYCHSGDISDPEFGHLRKCPEFTPPVVKLGPHVAPLGMRFYTGSMFPAEYRNNIFIAEHGSWNRSRKIGYRIKRVALSGDKPVKHEVFAEGWLQGQTAWGRPVDVLVMPDGALLVSDDHAGAIYRISYRRQ